MFSADLDGKQVIGRAKDAGLERALVILEAGHPAEAAQAARVEQLWPAVRFSIGVHPHQAQQFAANPEAAAAAVREQFASTPSARAVGEIGLDYHYDLSPREVQQAVLRPAAGGARAPAPGRDSHKGRRRGHPDDSSRGGRRRHPRASCNGFTGFPALADAGLALGFYMSLAGILTFPKAGDVRDTARRVPIDRLLVETDSPFLAPVPFRGKRNEPHVVRIVETLAEMHQMAPAALAEQTTANFHTLFRP